jgi:hypothetical protein
VPEGHAPSNRRLVQRFAAHLAHLLNDPGLKGDAVTVQAFALFTRVTQTLERREARGDSGPYDGLTGLKLLGPGTSPQEAALFYLDNVVRRALNLARDEPLHRGHLVFRALCRRGLDTAWAQAELARLKVIPDGGKSRVPADFAGVVERLARLSPDISESNPAKNTRAASGPLFLQVGGAAAEVAEEMSLWDAMTCGPATLRVLARGDKFNEFCSDMIKALEAANARYGTLIALGLSPRDWQDLSVNTAKKLSAFLGAARGKHAEVATSGAPSDRAATASPEDNLADWERAWKERPVPGFDSAKALWDSQLGHALRHCEIPTLVELGGDEMVEDPDDGEAKILEGLTFDRMIERGQSAGVLTAFDAWFLRKLRQGETLEALMAAPETRQALGKSSVSKKMIETYTHDLQERVRAYARSL